MSKPEVSGKEILEWLAGIKEYLAFDNFDNKDEIMYQAIRRLIEEQGLALDEDWLITKANAILYALRRRFKTKITAKDTVTMRDLLADVVMAAGIKLRSFGE